MKILIAVDGSKQSNQALQLVKSLPFKDATVLLAHTRQSIDVYSKELPDEARQSVEAFNKEISLEAEKIVTEAEKLLKSSSYNVESHILDGDPAEQLVQLITKAKVDLVAMGSRGLNPVTTFFLGSVSDSVLRHAPCSVLLFRGELEPTTEPHKAHFLVGYDDTASSRSALNFLKNFDGSAIDQVTMISCIQLSFYYGMSYSIATLDSWPRYKETLEESIQAEERAFLKDCPNVKFSADIITDALDISQELDRQAKDQKVDILVVGSKGKDLMERMLLGSVSNKLAHHAESPLLIVR